MRIDPNQQSWKNKHPVARSPPTLPLGTLGPSCWHTVTVPRRAYPHPPPPYFARQYVEFLRLFLCVSRGTGWRQRFDGGVTSACMSCSGTLQPLTSPPTPWWMQPALIRILGWGEVGETGEGGGRFWMGRFVGQVAAFARQSVHPYLKTACWEKQAWPCYD